MRILIYGLNFTPELTGIGKYSGEFAAYCATRGHEVRVVTAPPYYPQWRISEDYRKPWFRTENLGDVMTTRCPLWVPARLNGAWRLLHLSSFALSSAPVILVHSVWKPDVVFTVAPTLLTAPAARLASRFSGALSWLHIQDFELDAAAGLDMLPAKKLLLPIAQKFETVNLLRFDRVSTISHRMFEKLFEKGVPPNKRILFPNWVDTDKIYPMQQRNRLRLEVEIPETSTIVLYAGNLGSKQGLDIIPSCAKLLNHRSDIAFLIAGEGAFKTDLERIVRNYSNIKMLPLQPVDRLNELLNLADIHLLPQRADAADLVMPSKLSGMLASGKPVIAMANHGTELALVVSSIGRVTPPDNAERLAATIEELADNPKMRKTLGKSARSYALEHYAKNRVLPEIMDVMETLAKSKSSKVKDRGLYVRK